MNAPKQRKEIKATVCIDQEQAARLEAYRRSLPKIPPLGAVIRELTIQALETKGF